ncbi:hypothetical protein V5O48_000909 [Marasmius crinis-equi]|uniref:Protection of telomeres protein 1 n=1 Tax=Marasmius crinis-equi TaxID=585013 RepID=A0ABR3G018_9AGAR
MKRAVPDAAKPPSKRVKKTSESSDAVEEASIFQDPTRLVYVTDLRSSVDETGYIRGKVAMKWPIANKKYHILLDTPDSSLGSRRVKVDVYFQGKCAQLLRERDVQLDVQDEIVLGLREVVIEKKGQGSSKSFDLVLKYSEGVQLELVKRRHPQQPCGIVDTWATPSTTEAPTTEDILDPPGAESTSHDISWLANIPVLAPRSEEDLDPLRPKSHLERVEIKIESFEQSIEQTASASTTDAQKSPEPEAIPPRSSIFEAQDKVPELVVEGREPAVSSVTKADDPPTLSKKEQKHLKRKREKERVRELKRQEKERLEPLKHAEEREVPDKPNAATTSAEVSSTSSQPEKVLVPEPSPTVPPGPLDLKAGRKTRCCTLAIVDPSNCKKEDDSYRDPERSRSSMKIICFSKKHPYWLPQPQVGDVVILVDVKASSWNGGTNLLGSSGKFRWVIFSPKDERLHHGDGDPKARLKEDGMSYFSPFYEVRDEGEVRYCRDLVEWWKAIEEEEQRFWSRVVPVGVEEPGGFARPLQKEARPTWHIKDMTLTGVTNGFFDTTVEVVHCYKPEDPRYYCLYVTDYTEHEALASFEKPGLHRKLSKSVARLECWDGSRDISALATVGNYLSLKNVKCRLNNLGTYELKMQERKIRIMSEEDAEYDKHFAGLLERKKAHQEKYGSNDPSEIEHRLIADAGVDKFFSSVVEIIHRDSDVSESKRITLYITDYTFNPILRRTLLPQAIPNSLSGRVLKLVLFDGQLELSKQLKTGDFVSVHMMRITKNASDEGLSVKMGGEERLVQRLVRGADGHKDLILGVQRNKELWEKENPPRRVKTPQLEAIRTPGIAIAQEQKENLPQRATATHSDPQQAVRVTAGQEPLTPTTPKVTDKLPLMLSSTTKNDQPSTSTRPQLHYTPIKSVIEVETCPTKFRIRARIVDFFPSVEEFLCRFCNKCNKFLTKEQLACRDCNDSDREYVELRYRFWLTLEDDMGSKVDVSVVDNCTMLSEYPRADLEEDQDAYRELHARFNVFAGNAQAYIKDNENGQVTKLESPFLRCIVVALMNERNEKMYSLEDCELN